jgi:hypothetical protein
MRVVCGTEERCETHSPHPNLHLPLIEDFVDAVINDREPLVNHEAGRAVAMIEEEIYAHSHSHLASAR